VVAVAVLVFSTLAAVVGFAALGGFRSHAVAPAQAFDRSGPVGDLKAAELRLTYGAARLTLRSADLGPDLYRAHFLLPVGARPEADLAQGALGIRIPTRQRDTCFFWCESAHSDLTLTLDNRVNWKLSLDGGASESSLDLSRLNFSSLEMLGGAADATVELPAPHGTVTLSFAGGAESVRLRAPAGTQVQIRVSGGASSLVVNGSKSEGIGQDLEQRSGGYDTAQDRYEVSVSGGASSVNWQS
jgi:hypothetical protein